MKLRTKVKVIRAIERAFAFFLIALLSIIGLGTILSLASAIIGYVLLAAIPATGFWVYKKCTTK